MKINNIDHSGYINIKGGKHTAYDLKDGMLCIHVLDALPEIEGKQMILSSGFDGKSYLMFSSLPIKIPDNPLYPGSYNYKQHLDCAIRNFRERSAYTEARFRFDELQYFCPSTKMSSRLSDEQILFTIGKNVIKEFNIDIAGKKCNVQFMSDLEEQISERCRLESFSEIVVRFEKCTDLEFFHKVYFLVLYVFMFVCNRQNVYIPSMRLIGTYQTKKPNNGKMTDVTSRIDSEMFFFNAYQEPPEEEKVIAKTSQVRLFMKHIDKLFQMIADDISRESTDKTDLDESGNDGIQRSKVGTEKKVDEACISIASIHPSLKRRNRIDLQHSLHITGAFEFYVKRYLPNMREEKSYHREIKETLEAFIESHSGKAKKLCKSLLNHILDVPLSDKIIAAYGGYEGWAALKPCLEESWYKADDIEKLADVANEWRNELAHEKREYQPEFEVVDAIRLVEHLNYAIVLRILGYEDIEIKELLRHVLVR